jgi:hypothetical protein
MYLSEWTSTRGMVNLDGHQQLGHQQLGHQQLGSDSC